MKHAFRRRNAQALYDQHYGPNMTPMVDVVMVILIFFMASTAFLGPEWFLKTHLPRAGATPPPGAPEPTRLRVELSLSPENQPIATVGVLSGLTLDQLESKIEEDAKATTPDNVVILIAPAPKVPYDAVVRVHEMCARAGVTKVGLEP